MIDKSPILLAGLQKGGLPPWLCRYHGVAAVAEKVQEMPDLAIFIGPIITLFKAVLVASTEVRAVHVEVLLMQYFSALVRAGLMRRTPCFATSWTSCLLNW
jgi:hypothetical protein